MIFWRYKGIFSRRIELIIQSELKAFFMSSVTIRQYSFLPPFHLDHSAASAAMLTTLSIAFTVEMPLLKPYRLGAFPTRLVDRCFQPCAYYMFQHLIQRIDKTDWSVRGGITKGLTRLWDQRKVLNFPLLWKNSFSEALRIRYRKSTWVAGYR